MKTTELSSRQVVSVTRISGLVLVNAMIFQEILAEQNGDVLPLGKLIASEKDVIQGFGTHWQHIIDDINDYPIFYVAREILLNIPANKDSHDAILRLVDSARAIVRNRAALRHDLMGRIYHRLLADAKYLGTYYTSIPAATLLMKLALQPQNWQMDWSDLTQLKQFRVALATRHNCVYGAALKCRNKVATTKRAPSVATALSRLMRGFDAI
jgi:hypothetical protein